MPRPLYIGYLTVRGQATSDLYMLSSIEKGARALRQAVNAPAGPGDAEGSHLDLYKVTGQEMVDAAIEMSDVGCPFDTGPDYRVTLDPRGVKHIEPGL